MASIQEKASSILCYLPEMKHFPIASDSHFNKILSNTHLNHRKCRKINLSIFLQKANLLLHPLFAFLSFPVWLFSFARPTRELHFDWFFLGMCALAALIVNCVIGFSFRIRHLDSCCLSLVPVRPLNEEVVPYQIPLLTFCGLHSDHCIVKTILLLFCILPFDLRQMHFSQ